MSTDRRNAEILTITPAQYRAIMSRLPESRELQYALSDRSLADGTSAVQITASRVYVDSYSGSATACIAFALFLWREARRALDTIHPGSYATAEARRDARAILAVADRYRAMSG